MRRGAAVIMSVFAVFVIAGASFAYYYEPNIGFGLEDSGDGTEITVSGSLPADVRYRVFSDTATPERIYLFADPDYPGAFLPYRTQDKVLSSLKDLMSRRGYDGAELIDAERLAQLCSDPSAASCSGIVIMSGALPETIYPNDSENGLLTWLSNGGTLYWSGPDMGRFRALSNGQCIDTGNGYFGDGVNHSDDIYLVSETSDVAELMGFVSAEAQYGLRSDYPGSRVLGLHGEYSSLSVVHVSAGRVYILGSFLNSLYVEDFYTFADMMVIGITEDTVIKDSGIYHKGYGKGSFTIDGTSPGDTVYVSAGKATSVSGRLFRL